MQTSRYSKTLSNSKVNGSVDLYQVYAKQIFRNKNSQDNLIFYFSIYHTSE